MAASRRLTTPAQVSTPPTEGFIVTATRSFPLTSARLKALADLDKLHSHAEATRQAAEEVQAESRELVARCIEGRISRENERHE